MRRLVLAFAFALAALLALAAPAYAGGWAVVTLDSLPREVRAGQTLRLGFMVRQHGRAPIDSAFGKEPLKPYLAATNKDTGKSLRVDAKKEGSVGHFVVDVTFPSAGTWEWSITPPPFEGTRFEPLTVLPAAAGAEQSLAGDAALSPARLLQPSILRWTGVVLLLMAVALALSARRSAWMRRAALHGR